MKPPYEIAATALVVFAFVLVVRDEWAAAIFPCGLALWLVIIAPSEDD